MPSIREGRKGGEKDQSKFALHVGKTGGTFKKGNVPIHHSGADSFPVPTYLFFKGDERPGRNDVKVAGQAGKGERKVGTGR